MLIFIRNFCNSVMKDVNYIKLDVLSGYLFSLSQNNHQYEYLKEFVFFPKHLKKAIEETNFLSVIEPAEDVIDGIYYVQKFKS